MLAGCYRKSLALAQQYLLKTIAFPAISTGVYFPMERATRIAVTEMLRFLEQDTALKKVIMVSFSDRAYQCCLSVVAEFVPDS